jgi:hypothetical protein
MIVALKANHKTYMSIEKNLEKEGVKRDEPIEKPKNPENEEGKLIQLYSHLAKTEEQFKKWNKNQEAIENIRNSRGLAQGIKETNDTAAKIEAMKKEILTAEQNYLGVPQDMEGKEITREEATMDSSELMDSVEKMGEEFKESKDKAEEEWMQKWLDESMIQFKKEYPGVDKAINWKQAEMLYRKKFPIFFKQARETSDEVVHTTFYAEKFKNEKGEEVSYIKDVAMENKVPAGQTVEKPKDDSSEDKSKKDEKLIGDKEKGDIDKLEGAGYKKTA